MNRSTCALRFVVCRLYADCRRPDTDGLPREAVVARVFFWSHRLARSARKAAWRFRGLETRYRRARSRLCPSAGSAMPESGAFGHRVGVASLRTRLGARPWSSAATRWSRARTGHSGSTAAAAILLCARSCQLEVETVLGPERSLRCREHRLPRPEIHELPAAVSPSARDGAGSPGSKRTRLPCREIHCDFWHRRTLWAGS